MEGNAVGCEGREEEEMAAGLGKESASWGEERSRWESEATKYDGRRAPKEKRGSVGSSSLNREGGKKKKKGRRCKSDNRVVTPPRGGERGPRAATGGSLRESKARLKVKKAKTAPATKERERDLNTQKGGVMR